ncbi:MAG: substrate-binding periplasmic protein [Aeromonadaceae bacterium]
MRVFFTILNRGLLLGASMVWRGALIIALLWCGQLQVAGCEIRIFQADSRYAYRTNLLQLILDQTRDEGECTLVASYTDVTPDRGLLLLKEKRLDVVSMPTTVEREEAMRPIKIDIMRGILGYRVLLIRKEKQADFARVTKMADLRQFTLGFGSQWADLPILQKNGLNVISSPQYENLFTMLAKGRFDAFPRGLNEAWNEVAERQQSLPELAVETELALYYPNPVYFFVNSQDGALARRLQRGLDKALADGSMQRLFMRYHAGSIARSNLAQRRLFMLNNAQLPSGTPFPDTSWWLPAEVLKPRVASLQPLVCTHSGC